MAYALVCPGLIDIAAISGYYAQMTGVLAGFAFTAMVVILSPAERDRIGDEKQRNSGVLLTLFAAFVALLITTLLYSVLAGEKIQEARGRAATEELLNAVPFGLAVIMLFHGTTLLMHMNRRIDRTTARTAQVMTVVVIPALAMYYIASGVSDTDSARAAIAGSCAPIRINLLGVALSIVLAVILGAFLVPRLQSQRCRRVASQHRDAVPIIVLLATVVAAVAAGEVSGKKPGFLMSSAVVTVYLLATFALLVLIGLGIAWGQDVHNAPGGAFAIGEPWPAHETPTASQDADGAHWGKPSDTRHG
jgi:hypothetical protein